VCADSAERSHVRIHERRETEEQLLALRGPGPSESRRAAVVAADVRRYAVLSDGDA
jgi:hypothetical protein